MKSLWFFGFHDLMYYQWNILEFKYLFSLLAPDIKILCIATLIMNVSLFFINDPNIRASSLYNMVDSVVEIPHNLFVLILGHLLCLYLCLAGSKLYLYVCMCIYYVTVTKKIAKQVQSLKNSKITNKVTVVNQQASKLGIAPQVNQTTDRDDMTHGAIALQLVRTPSLN